MAMPVAMTKPMLKRDTAPAPVAKIKGKTPSTIAAVVIKIGLNRMPAALSIASRFGHTFFLFDIGKLNNQNSVFTDQTHQGNQTYFGINV